MLDIVLEIELARRTRVEDKLLAENFTYININIVIYISVFPRTCMRAFEPLAKLVARTRRDFN
jgi:hypothetical protein